MAARVIQINFDKLKREVQDNLLDSLRGEFAPRPILMRLGARRSMEAWIALAVGAAVLLAILCVAGFGSVASVLSIHPTWVVVLYALLAATSAIAVLNALGCRARVRSLPFAPGVYLFPASVIDARERTLRVHALAELTSVSAGRGGEVVVAFGPTRFSFALADRSQTQRAVQAVETARDRMRAPLSDQDRRRLDPLAPPVVAGPFTSGVPIARAAPLWERYRVPLAALVGCAAGAGLFFARNALSDARMLAWAKARDDVASYASYLARGRRNRELVSQVLLPRAALRAAVAKGTVEAIDEHRRAYPATGIEAEIAAARRAALVAELGRARGAGTFAALLSFAERYPEHGLGPAFDEAKHALYARALERYRQQVSEPFRELVGRLVASSERAGPRKTGAGYRGVAIQVRMRRLPSKDIERADDLVRQNPMFNGAPSLPSRYVAAARLSPHEATTADGLAKGLARTFEPEIATFEPGPPLDGAAELPALSAPTLVVNYRVEPSGAAYALKKPRGIFLGLTFFCTAEFLLPGDATPLRTKLTSTQRIPAAIIKQGMPGAPPGALEAAVYDEMIRAAFADLQSHYLAKWFKQGAARQ
jgi:hypothetical protein